MNPQNDECLESSKTYILWTKAFI